LLSQVLDIKTVRTFVVVFQTVSKSYTPQLVSC